MSQRPPNTVSPPFESARENKALALPEYGNTRLCGHNRLRRQRERQLRQLPFLYDYLRRMQEQCEKLKQELAEVRQQKDAFQQETFTLQGLIKLTDHPELVEAAANEAATSNLREEVNQLQGRVRQLERDKVRCLLQSEEACGLAEFYKRLSKQVVERSLPMQQRARAASFSPTADVLPGKTSSTCSKSHTSLDGCGDEDLEAKLRSRLCAALAAERLRSQLLEEKFESLQASLSAVEASRVASSSSYTVCDEKSGSAEDAEQQVHVEGAIALPLQVSAAPLCEARVCASEMPRMLRFMEILRSQNRMLTKSVAALAQRNVAYAQEVAALKLSCSRLRGGTAVHEQ
ncbi:hypothetical protein ABL78_6303 [Leptomonas seymouri]|uniref:Uncharacterized protein n=1 Tax=Leptomonas seymouri TaxID=5684 RepID=A0A0N1I3I4_LEPSE|nr:hypothetical protein ABL78_6303 [Leptomonas seymouri]|eukprot:KPI84630.1 hypothetical protein ABL78_6303 [Leptomonas seymouri]